MWLVTVPWAVLTALHYLTPAGGHAHHAPGAPPVAWHLLHDLYRRLYYLPILAAALLLGLRGGLATAAVVSATYLPHVVHRWNELPSQRYEALFEIVLYHVAGALLGSLAEALRRQRDALHRTDRLRGAGELAAGMAHEVRNPLGGITGAAERLARDDLSAAERRELLGIIGREAARLDGVLRDFLAYARPAPLTRTPSDLNAVVAETVALVTPTAQRRGIAIAAAGAALPAIAMDPAKVKQALLNLLLNAVQASPDGARVEIETRLSGRRAEAVIRDRGAGLPPEAAATLFTPFSTTKPGGTGLGLPVARQILEAHGGGLALDPAPGGGTAARLWLPLSR